MGPVETGGAVGERLVRGGLGWFADWTVVVRAPRIGETAVGQRLEGEADVDGDWAEQACWSSMTFVCPA